MNQTPQKSAWPHNLLAEIFDPLYAKIDQSDWTQYLEVERRNGLEIINSLIDILPERSRMILRLRYESGMTYAAIAASYQCSRANIERIVSKSIWQMLREITRRCAVADAKAQDDKMLIKIEAMNLSVRAYNCLKRDGVTAIADIIARADKLLKIRNMGPRTAHEVISRVYEMTGIQIPYPIEEEKPPKPVEAPEIKEEKTPKLVETPKINGIPVSEVEAALKRINTESGV